MTPPIFHLDDEVETKNGRRFKISQIWKRTDGSFAYSDPTVSWVPESELKFVNKAPLSPMQVTCTYDPVDCEYRAIQVSCPCGRKAEIAMPAELKIGDCVEIIGPDTENDHYHTGGKFKITRIDVNCTPIFSGHGNPWYPSSSLRLVEELKIGDWVQLIEGDEDGYRAIIQISDVRDSPHGKQYFDRWHCGYWFACDLRKLTPEEIEQHLVKDLPSPKDVFESRIVAYCRATNDGNISIHERLSAIEKRLTFVEKIQRGQDDLVGRAIRDGVVEILDFRRSA